MKRRALITGVNGQDGSYLAEWLVSQGYEVFGTDRSPRPEHLAKSCPIEDMIIADLMEPDLLGRLVREVKPDEVYHLAAHHFSSQTDDNRLGRLQPFIQVNLLTANSALEAIAANKPSARFFYAASAQIFGKPSTAPQNEETPFNPQTPYAISKCAGVHLCRYFREARGVFTSVGILYNHESPRRGPSFITTQIARAAALASIGKPEPLAVRDLDAVVDWGAAEDYVKAMWLMLQHDSPLELTIASGIPRTIMDFAQAAFDAVGLNPIDYLTTGPKMEKSSRVPYVGDNRNLKRLCGWEPRISFERLVREMVTEQISRESRT